MPEELDPTTARIVSELSASMLPTLSKSINSAIHINEVVNALDRTNMISQDLKNQIEKAVKSGIDEGRSGRNVMLQSIRTALEEISSLRKVVDRVPENFENAIKNIKPDDNSMNILQELSRISELLNELIEGITNFSQVYAQDRTKIKNETLSGNFESLNDSQILSENNSRLDKLINNSLPGLEGLVKAHEKTQSHELKEFSNRLNEERKTQNNSIIIKILIGISGASLLLSLITTLIMIFK